MPFNTTPLQPASRAHKLKEIAASALKLGTIGFGGIAGMVATIEKEMVVRRKWIDTSILWMPSVHRT